MYTDADFIHEEFRLARVSEKHFDSGNVSDVEFNREYRQNPAESHVTAGPRRRDGFEIADRTDSATLRTSARTSR
jgi:hypothetical protein